MPTKALLESTTPLALPQCAIENHVTSQCFCQCIRGQGQGRLQFLQIFRDCWLSVGSDHLLLATEQGQAFVAAPVWRKMEMKVLNLGSRFLCTSVRSRERSATSDMWVVARATSSSRTACAREIRYAMVPGVWRKQKVTVTGCQRKPALRFSTTTRNKTRAHATVLLSIYVYDVYESPQAKTYDDTCKYGSRIIHQVS